MLQGEKVPGHLLMRNHDITNQKNPTNSLQRLPDIHFVSLDFFVEILLNKYSGLRGNQDYMKNMLNIKVLNSC